MNILILEDSQERMKFFRSWLVGNNIESYSNVRDFAIAINEKKYDTIFLDHDLEGEEMVSIDYENTGSGAAKLMVESKIDRSTPIVIHSLNPVGAINIEEVLKSGKFTNVRRIKFLDLK